MAGDVRPAQSDVIWRRIAERTENHLTNIERGVASLLEDALTRAHAASCRADASLLADWLFALDLVVAGRLTRDITKAFDGDPEPHSARAIATKVQQLRGVLRMAEGDWANADVGTQKVHIVSAPDAQIDAIAWHLRQAGIDLTYSPQFFTAPDGLDLLLVHAPHPEDAQSALDAIRDRFPTAPRAVVHPRDASAEDLLGIASSAELLLRHDDSPRTLASEILATLQPLQQAWNQVLLYGGNTLYPPLARVGFNGRMAQSVDDLIAAVADGAQIVVIGPGATHRPEVVRLLRAVPATRAAVIAVTYDDDAELSECRRAGADVIIPPDHADGSWADQLRAITVPLDRSTVVAGDKDVVVAKGHRAWVSVDRAIHDVQRGRGIAALALIDIPEVVSEAAMHQVQQFIAREFRSDDTVGFLTDQQCAVVLRGATAEAAVERIERLLKGLGAPALAGLAGIAHFPSDGLGARALIEAASTAANRSRNAGGPTVVDADWFPGLEERLDVLVVESDQTLSRLLEQLFERDGFSTRCITTGSSALTTLTGPEPIAPPRLLVLELDALGADGMMILRSLARAGVLRQTSVILTCALVNDGQLREAFELGAIDVIRKPFSSVVLRNRVTRALS